MRERIVWYFTRIFFPSMDLTKHWFTFGKNIYGPVPIPPEILEHEKVHIAQQGNIFMAIICVVFYTLSKRFRYFMELPAYQAQLDYYRRTDWRNAEKYKVAIAKLMSGPQYKHMVSYERAYSDLKLLL